MLNENIEINDLKIIIVYSKNMTNNLSKNIHWENLHKNKSSWFINHWFFSTIIEWLQNYEYFTSIKKYLSNNYKNAFEVWCAPWNYLVRFNKKFWLNPNGIEYTKSGFEITKENLKSNNINWNIIYWDFFDENFIKENNEKFDFVYSLWFIEHFENVQDVIDKHFQITKKGWLVVISIPNFKYFNRYLTEKKILDIHNLDIMDINILKQYFTKYEIKEIKYNWWLFNIWLFYYNNKIIEKIRFLFFIIQRFLFEPFFIILYKLWVDLSNKYTSPQILVIAEKK